MVKFDGRKKVMAFSVQFRWQCIFFFKKNSKTEVFDFCRLQTLP